MDPGGSHENELHEQAHSAATVQLTGRNRGIFFPLGRSGVDEDEILCRFSSERCLVLVAR